MAWPASIPTFVPGGAATSAAFNDISDALRAIGDAGTAYTPTWTSTVTSPTMGATTVTGSYRLTGKTADIHIVATVGAGFSPGSNLYRFSLPAGLTPLRTTSHDAVGTCIVWDASTGIAYPLTVFQLSGTHVSCVTGTPVGMSPGVPITWATGDTISIHIPRLELA